MVYGFGDILGHDLLHCTRCLLVFQASSGGSIAKGGASEGVGGLGEGDTLSSCPVRVLKLNSVFVS